MEFEVGDKCRSTGDTEAYYAGVNENKRHVFELISTEGITSVSLPKGYISKGNNTYWSYGGIESEFTLVEKARPQFEVGKWYKSYAKESDRSGYDYYGKFLRWDGSAFVASECSLIEELLSYQYTFMSDYKWHPVTDLSEIQYLLPEGHPDKLRYEVVHCTTQEEWIFVLSKLRQSCALAKEGHKFEEYIKRYSEGVAVAWKDESYCGLDYFKKYNSKIYTFREFCDKFNYKFEKENSSSLVGRYLKVIDNYSISHYPCKIGDYLKYVGSVGTTEYWGAYTSQFEDDGTNNSKYYGDEAHKYTARFELMPEGFSPEKEVKQKEIMNEYVHCENQSQWNIAAEVLGRKSVINFREIGDSIDLKRPDSSIMFEIGKRDPDIKFHTFQDWLRDKVPMNYFQGRYIKALKDSPDGGSVFEDEIGFIKTCHNSLPYSVDFPRHSGYIINPKTFILGEKYSILPKSYTPEKEKPKEPEVMVDYKNGDYIVCLPENKAKSKGAGYREHWCYQVGRKDGNILFGCNDGNGVYTDSVRLATIEEIQMFKIKGPFDTSMSMSISTPKEDKWYPKVDDWVVITKSKENWNDINMTPLVGKVYQIKTCFNQDQIKFTEDRYYWSYKQGHFRKAESHEIPSVSAGKAKPASLSTPILYKWIKLTENEEKEQAAKFLKAKGFRDNAYGLRGNYLHIYEDIKAYQFLTSLVDSSYTEISKEDLDISSERAYPIPEPDKNLAKGNYFLTVPVKSKNKLKKTKQTKQVKLIIN